MKVVLSTLGKFHTFDLARELHARGALQAIYSGYPRFKLHNEKLPQHLVRTFPWVHAAYMGFPWRQHLPDAVLRQWWKFDTVSFGTYVAHNLPECDVYVGLSGSALLAGKKAHQNGAKFVCDRGSAHIREQDNILREEHEYWGIPFAIAPHTLEQEEAEYNEADVITVPSSFAFKSFQTHGVQADKLKLLPYGVDLSMFHPIDKPDTDSFNILFVGGMRLQKGVQYLVQAFQKLVHPAKSLTFVGNPSPEVINMLRLRGLWQEEIKILGHMNQAELKNIMSRSHVLVLPSVQDGFGMVMAQAMACGCPVIATTNTGAADLFTHGQEGYIVPIRDVDALADSMQFLADNPEAQVAMSAKAISRVQKLGGWHSYGDQAVSIYENC